MSAAPDIGDGATKHPRFTHQLVGHADAESALIKAWQSDRLAHAWMLCGPRGIGKATLAWRFARFLLSDKGDHEIGLFGDDNLSMSMAIPSDSQVFQMVAQQSHPGLISISRTYDEKAKRVRKDIVVDDIRALHRFFSLTSTEGRWRVAIIDAADEMNHQAANALLKILEEPPARSLIVLIAHAPGQLMATLHSRCQKLTLRPLNPDEIDEVLAGQGVMLDQHDMEVANLLAEGSPGRILALIEQGGLDIYATITKLLGGLPKLDIRALHELGDQLSRKGADDSFTLFCELFRGILHRLIRDKTGATITIALHGEAQIFTRLAGPATLDQWIEVWENTGRLFQRTEAVNLDKKQAVILAFTAVQKLIK